MAPSAAAIAGRGPCRHFGPDEAVPLVVGGAAGAAVAVRDFLP